MPTRRPAGSGWAASTWAMSKSCRIESARMTPACARISSSAPEARSSSPVSRTWWPGGSSCPVRSDFTTTTGLTRLTRRAMRANLRGLPIDSRYRPTARVSGSSSQYWRRSLPDRSARLPAETKVEMPRPSRVARARRAVPRAPDWLKSPRLPRSGRKGDRDEFRDTSSAVLAMPKLLGPTTRMPWERAVATISRCSARPSGPASAKPEEMTTTALTSWAAQSRTTSETDAAGTAMTARSAGSVRSSRLRTVCTPAIDSASGWTTVRVPWKPAEVRLRTSRFPVECRLREAPMTTTEDGCRIERTLRASARCSREAMTARARSVGSISNRTATTPSSNSRETS